MANADGTLAQELSYDAWGRLRNPQTQTVYGVGEQPVLKLGRGYTGHEHLSLFGLVNMNARLYDPVLGRFLSPDPYVQMPDNLQNLNRYSYCLNNPLAYVDEDGEFWWFVAAVAVGAIVNVATHWDEIEEGGWGAGIAYAVVGGAAGALGSVAGGAVASAIGISGFVGGTLIGAASGAASGFALGSGNTMVEGGGIGDILSNGVYGAIGGAVGGAVTGGMIGGASSWIKGENFWTGKPIRNVPDVRPRPANVEPDPLPEQVAPGKPMGSSQLPEMTDSGSSKIQDIANRLKPGLQRPSDIQEFRISLVEGDLKIDFRVETHTKVNNVFKDMNLHPDDYVRHANIQMYQRIEGSDKWRLINVPGTKEKNFHIFLNLVNKYVK